MGNRQNGSLRNGERPCGLSLRWLLGRFLRGNEAVSALEYAILVGVIAVALAAAMLSFSDTLRDAIVALFARIPAITAGVGT